jgi:hypothetical protein
VKEAIAPGADQNRLRRRCAAGVAERTGECFPAGLSESAYKTADFSIQPELLRGI